MDYKADGGLFRGAGGPREDKNLVAVSDGEFWVNADATAKNLPLLNRINKGDKVLARADGGLVGDPALSSDPSLGANTLNSPSLAADPSAPTGSGTTAADPASSSATAATGIGASIKSGLQVALDKIRAHITTMYQWGGFDLASGVDCSGLVGDGLLLATGKQPDHRVGDTTSLMRGEWPGMIKGATRNDLFIAGVNPDHVVGSIMGTKIEARQSGEQIRMGSDAADPFDEQFVQQWHLDPTLIDPPYQAGASDDPTATGGDYTGLGTGNTASDKAARYKAAAQKELAEAKKHDAAAEADMTKASQYKAGLPEAKKKHLDAMQAHLDAAQKADDLAAKTTGAVHQRHLDAAAHDRELAQKSQTAAGKVGGQGQRYLDEAAKARQLAADERKRAQEDMAKAAKAENTPTGKKSKKDGADTNGGWMTWEQAGQKAGGIGADFLAESFGVDNTFITDPNQSAVLRIGKQLTNVKTSGKPPNWGASPFLPSQLGTQNSQTQDADLSSLLPPTHDLGGPVPPGLSLVNNKTGHDEVMVINPQLMNQRQPEPAAPRGRGRSDRRDGPYVHIDKWIAGSNDQAEANRLGRTVGQYVRTR